MPFSETILQRMAPSMKRVLLLTNSFPQCHRQSNTILHNFRKKIVKLNGTFCLITLLLVYTIHCGGNFVPLINGYILIWVRI